MKNSELANINEALAIADRSTKLNGILAVLMGTLTIVTMGDVLTKYDLNEYLYAFIYVSNFAAYLASTINTHKYQNHLNKTLESRLNNTDYHVYSRKHYESVSKHENK